MPEKKYVYVEEESLASLIAQAKVGAKDVTDVPTIEAIREKSPTKPWFKYHDYRSAEISFDDRAPGTIVHLHDAQAVHNKRIRENVRYGEGSVEIPVEGVAALCMAHISKIEGEKHGEIFTTAMPQLEAKFDAWVKWCEGMREKDLSRLRKGIWMFRTKEIEEGND